MSRIERDEYRTDNVDQANLAPALPGTAPEARPRSRRGFAAMDPEQHREISRRGGQASHESGRGHEWNEDEAREAGRRGGEARWRGRARQSQEPHRPVDTQDRRGLAR